VLGSLRMAGDQAGFLSFRYLPYSTTILPILYRISVNVCIDTGTYFMF